MIIVEQSLTRYTAYLKSPVVSSKPVFVEAGHNEYTPRYMYQPVSDHPLRLELGGLLLYVC